MEENKDYLKFFTSDHGRILFETNNPLVRDKIYNVFSEPNKAFKYSKYAKLFVCPITPRGTFLPGMTYDICIEVKKYFPNLEIDFRNIKEILLPFSHNVKLEDIDEVENEKYIYYDYQANSILKGLQYGRGIFHIATAGGKSLLMYGLIKNIWKFNKDDGRLLILVPNIQLVEQLYKDFIEYGCPKKFISTFSSSNREIQNTRIIISNRQWLERHGEELYNDFKYLFVDEVHQLGSANGVTKYVNERLKVNSKFGFTGTIPDECEDRWSVIGTCGKIIYKVLPKELQEKNRISNLKIITLKFNHTSSPPKPLTYKIEINEKTGKEKRIDLTDEEIARKLYPTEWEFIEKSKGSNATLSKLAYSLNGNTIILHDHIEHGNLLAENIVNLNENKLKEIYIINGEAELDYREDVRACMEKKSNVILVANSKCFSTGINIKNIKNIIFAFSQGKAAVKLMQSIGRGLRLHEDKTELLLIDIWHNCKYSIEHFSTRVQLYKENYKIENISYKEVKVND